MFRYGSDEYNAYKNELAEKGFFEEFGNYWEDEELEDEEDEVVDFD